MKVSPSITGIFQSTSASTGVSPAACEASRLSSASWPLPASETVKPSPTRMRLRMVRMARESSMTRARMSGSFASEGSCRPVDGCSADEDALPRVVDAGGGLGPAKEQETARPQSARDAAQDRTLGRGVEVDENVAQQHDVELR